MSQLHRRDFACTVYRTRGIDAYPATAELYIGTTASFLVYRDGRVRQLSTGEDASVNECIADQDPLRTDTLELIKYDGTFYTTDPDVEDVKLGHHYLVDGETVFSPVSKTNMVKKQQPIENITDDEFSPDHQNIYIVQRDNPFGRFRYKTNHVRRFIKSDRVEKLEDVSPL